MCFGTYNATLVDWENAASFPKEARLGPSHIDFTLEETRRLFRQYEREYEVTVHEDVVKMVNSITGGHAGLTNACGHVIQEYQEKYPTLKNLTMDQWPQVLMKTLSLIRSVSGPEQRISSVLENGESLPLLRKLIDDELGVNVNEANTNDQNGFLNLGFAKHEVRVSFFQSFFLLVFDFVSFRGILRLSNQK